MIAYDDLKPLGALAILISPYTGCERSRSNLLGELIDRTNRSAHTFVNSLLRNQENIL